MHNWNKVFLRYCSGEAFIGNSSIDTPLRTIYFKGRVILESVKDDLLTRGLIDATDVIIGGCSAGAVAIYNSIDKWANWI